ncbi:MAG: SDR family NAD(P)-dependent oxidoreductase [Tomitella sp.]|nr:SDR family NAD(P)-dependent oxidoreductase [Tomitella sp.]
MLGLADSDAVALAATADECRARGADVLAAALDVADDAAVCGFAAALTDFAGQPSCVFTLAGMLYSGTVADTPSEDFARVIETNLLGVVHVVRAFLPHVLASGCGHFVTVSSAFGLVTAPGSSAYSASKAAVMRLSEALRMEMRNEPVTVTCVAPGGVRTAIAERAGVAPGVDHSAFAAAFSDRIARTSAERAAARILRGVERGRRTVYIGWDARLAALLTKLGPAVTERILGRVPVHQTDETAGQIEGQVTTY